MTENEAIKELETSIDLAKMCIQNCERKREIQGYEMAIKALEEVQQYREIGALEELKQAQKYVRLSKNHGTIGQVIDVCAEYEEIGTVEECRDAVERLKAKRPDGGRDIDGKDYLICPNCCAIVADGEWTAKFCPDCGQKLDWSSEE